LLADYFVKGLPELFAADVETAADAVCDYIVHFLGCLWDNILI